nr:LacI family DNA-binding transcriptional regulator [Carnobacterium sp.]
MKLREGETMKITIKEIAQEAGVSMTTVSNVINNKKKRVSKETVEIIEKIIKKYNYIPNMNARSLVKSSSKMIAVIYYNSVTDISFNDPFMAELLSGIEKEAKANNHFVLIRNITTIEEIADLQKNWSIGGFIIVGLLKEYFLDINKMITVPTIYIDAYIPNTYLKKENNIENTLFLNSDDWKGMSLSTQYLIDSGHKNIAFLSYINSEDGVIQQRLESYKHTLLINGLVFNKKSIFQVSEKDGPESIEKQLEKIVETLKDITAIVTTADILAAHLIKTLKIKKYKIPEDLSIVGFDNMHFSSFLEPPLTTIQQNVEEKGKIAMKLLLGQEEMPKDLGINKYKKVILPVELIIRNTVSNLEK